VILPVVRSFSSGVVLWLVVVHGSCHEIEVWRLRAFLVRLPSGVRYWTVLDEDLVVVGEADAFLRQVRFGRDGSELTTRSYAGGIALFLRWCRRTVYRAKTTHVAVDQGCWVVQAARRYLLITPPMTRWRRIGASSGILVAGLWVGGR
jgi:hypothetical protein